MSEILYFLWDNIRHITTISVIVASVGTIIFMAQPYNKLIAVIGVYYGILAFFFITTMIATLNYDATGFAISRFMFLLKPVLFALFVILLDGSIRNKFQVAHKASIAFVFLVFTANIIVSPLSLNYPSPNTLYWLPINPLATLNQFFLIGSVIGIIQLLIFWGKKYPTQLFIFYALVMIAPLSMFISLLHYEFFMSWKGTVDEGLKTIFSSILQSEIDYYKEGAVTSTDYWRYTSRLISVYGLFLGTAIPLIYYTGIKEVKKINILNPFDYITTHRKKLANHPKLLEYYNNVINGMDIKEMAVVHNVSVGTIHKGLARIKEILELKTSLKLHLKDYFIDYNNRTNSGQD
jgi:hypothetical protein